MNVNRVFDLTGRTAFITGAGGLLGPKHAEAIIEFGGNVILTDHHLDRVEQKAATLNEKYERQCAVAYHMDVADPKSVQTVVNLCDKIDILINNAAKDPKVKKGGGTGSKAGGGMTEKGVKKYKRDNPGSKLQTAVTTPPSELKPGSKAAKRRKSFCARSKSWTSERGKAARRRWNC